MPVISRNLAVYSSCGDTPSAANDDDYWTMWQGCSAASTSRPTWIALDLSPVPSLQRQHVVLAYYSNHAFIEWSSGNSYLNLMDTFTIDGHPAPGGTTPPADGDPGWVNLQTVTGATLYCQSYPLDLTGGGMHAPFNWIRVRSTLVQGGPMLIQFDVHNASATQDDRWLALGDALSASVFLDQTPRTANDGTFAQRLSDLDPQHSRQPVLYEAAGSYVNDVTNAESDAQQLMNLFHPKFVSMAYGVGMTVQFGCDATCIGRYASAMRAVVGAIEAGGGVPIIAHLPWHPDPTIAATLMSMNGELDAIIASDANIVTGPDLWTVFNQHPEYWDSTTSPPNAVITDAGGAVARTAWATAMLQHGGVYCR
jgi:hypothetical protein